MIFADITSINSAGEIRGYCYSSTDNDECRTVTIGFGNIKVGTFLCAYRHEPQFSQRTEIPERCGFVGTIPFIATWEPDFKLYLTDVATGKVFESRLDLADILSTRASLRASQSYAAFIDSVSEEGEVSGWAWDKDNPSEKLTLNVFVSGVHTGSVAAANYREDLENAQIGDGRFGYRFYLPWPIAPNHGEFLLSIREAKSGLILAEKILSKPLAHMTIADRIAEIERKLRLIGRP